MEDNVVFKLTNLDDIGDDNIENRERFYIIPGICAEYIDKDYIENFHNNPSNKTNYEIIYNYRGKLECQNRDQYSYIMPGDSIINLNGQICASDEFCGIKLNINIDILAASLPELTAINFEMGGAFDILKSENAVINNAEISNALRGIYQPPEGIESNFRKVKVLELLLLLSVFTINNNGRRKCSENQIILAKEVSKFLIDNIENHYTIEELAKMFHVSQTQLKNSFKRVFGESVYSYIRTRKMKIAAEMLENDRQNITEIAGLFGYDNGSKFAKAFKDVNGLTPSAYRKKMLVKNLNISLY